MLGKYWLERSCIWAVLRWGARWWRGRRGEAWRVCLGSINKVACNLGRYRSCLALCDCTGWGSLAAWRGRLRALLDRETGGCLPFPWVRGGSSSLPDHTGNLL